MRGISLGFWDVVTVKGNRVSLIIVLLEIISYSHQVYKRELTKKELGATDAIWRKANELLFCNFSSCNCCGVLPDCKVTILGEVAENVVHNLTLIVYLFCLGNALPVFNSAQ
jgi:hypothetical protein